MSPRRSSTGRTPERKFFRDHFSRREGHFPGGNFFAENPKKAVDNLPFGWYNYTRRQEHDGKTPAHGGLAQLGERLHGMQEVSGSIPLFSTKKALYFVGSTVLFFLLKLVFGGCIASPAPFLGFCRRFLYNPQLLTLRFIHHPEVTARCSVRTVHIQGAMHPIYYFCILQYVKESLENHSKKCSKQKRNTVILT